MTKRVAGGIYENSEPAIHPPPAHAHTVDGENVKENPRVRRQKVTITEN